MTDYFALLAEPRRPWLEPEALKKKFLALSANCHPDKIHSAGDTEKAAATKKFAEINSAYQCLSETKSRLQHLLELETGSKPKEIQQIPAPLADLFAEVATLCKNADAFLAEMRANQSPLIRVQFFEPAQHWMERLVSLRKKLGEQQEDLNNKLKALDEIWVNSNPPARHEILPELEKIYRLNGYFNRWNSQIQERTAQITL